MRIAPTWAIVTVLLLGYFFVAFVVFSGVPFAGLPPPLLPEGRLYPPILPPPPP